MRVLLGEKFAVQRTVAAEKSDFQKGAFRNVICCIVHLQTNALTHKSSGHLALESWQNCGKRQAGGYRSVFAFGDRDNPRL